MKTLVKVIILLIKLMVNSPKSSNRIHPLSVVAAVIVAGLLLLLAYVLILMVGREKAPGEQPQPSQAITIIPAPTETPIVILPTAMATPTSGAPVLPMGVIGVGVYVKVGRTEGTGLRMRAEASTAADIRFIAMDEEVFKVIGGPVQADDYTWWQIEAPYDKNRSGWSVESFLDVVDLTTPTP